MLLGAARGRGGIGDGSEIGAIGKIAGGGDRGMKTDCRSPDPRLRSSNGQR
jgi:hypothetical protein